MCPQQPTDALVHVVNFLSWQAHVEKALHHPPALCDSCMLVPPAAFHEQSGLSRPELAPSSGLTHRQQHSRRIGGDGNEECELTLRSEAAMFTPAHHTKTTRTHTHTDTHSWQWCLGSAVSLVSYLANKNAPSEAPTQRKNSSHTQRENIYIYK